MVNPVSSQSQVDIVRHGNIFFPICDENTFVCLSGSLKNSPVCKRRDPANSCDQHLGHFFRVLYFVPKSWQSVFNKPVWELSFERHNFCDDSPEGSASGGLYICDVTQITKGSTTSISQTSTSLFSELMVFCFYTNNIFPCETKNKIKIWNTWLCSPTNMYLLRRAEKVNSVSGHSLCSKLTPDGFL